MRPRIPALLLAVLANTTPAQEAPAPTQQEPRLLRPGAPIDYAGLAFFPERWQEQGVDTRMVPWRGRQIVLMTPPGDHDRLTITRAVDRLDAGWQVYLDLTGRAPRRFKIHDGLPVIAGLPTHRLTCGYGCGYVGSTGIELGGFMARDLAMLQADPSAAPHYWYYEQGRNFYTFGDRHSLFVTGFAVFMRYVCMDALGLADPELGTRTTIESCEALYAASEIPFLDAFTNLGDGEKTQRLRDAEGRPVYPSDQPCIYASAMLALRRDHGGDAWLRRFYRHLANLPPLPAEDRDGALRQCHAWLVCASAAAGRDLSSVFVDRWRLPLGAAERQALADFDWRAADLDVRDLVTTPPGPRRR